MWHSLQVFHIRQNMLLNLYNRLIKKIESNYLSNMYSNCFDVAILQVFHICQDLGRHDSFLCPNGTVFNQLYFVCDWWYNFACDSAARYFDLNQFIYELPQRHHTENEQYTH